MYLFSQVEEQSTRKPAVPRRLSRRLLDRLDLIRSWVATTFLPRYWKQAILAMLLITTGKSLEMAGFIGAVQIVSHSIAPQTPLPLSLSSSLLVGGMIVCLVILLAAFSGYRGQRLAVETVNDYESISFANAIHNIRLQREPGFEIPDKEAKEIMMQAPRFMARGMLQIMNSATATLLVFIGFIGCLVIYPKLTLIIGLLLIVCSPVYVLAAAHGTTVGQKMRQASDDFGKTKKQLSKKWLASDHFDTASAHREVLGNKNYVRFLNAYGKRLILSPQSQLIGSLTFSICLLIGFVWVGMRYQLNSNTLSTFIIYIIFLRVFFSGIVSVFSSVQMLNSFIPYFIRYLMLDPRVKSAGLQEWEVPIKS